MPEKYVIRVEGWNQPDACPVWGQYLEWYDPYADAWGGADTMRFTADLDRAEKFNTIAEAETRYRQPLLDSRNLPRQRKDAPGATGDEKGAERPLTAFSVLVLPESEAHAYQDAGARRLLDAILRKGEQVRCRHQAHSSQC